ncbi:MAG TPA: hypothetical protein VG621_00390 [Candidatus Paceibacterota bacterium]|nr:hypothetical protein [Candidatus Paceibacterota bacterium]
MNPTIDTIEFDFIDTPEEVLDFLYSTDYTLRIEKLAESLRLSSDKKNILDGCITGILTETLSKTEADRILQTLIITPESYKVLREQIEKDFVMPAYATVIESIKKAHEEEQIEKELASLDKEGGAASLQQPVFDSFNKTLTQPTTFAPTKREVGGTATAPSPTKAESPRIDPYREIPEE